MTEALYLAKFSLLVATHSLVLRACSLPFHAPLAIVLYWDGSLKRAISIYGTGFPKLLYQGSMTCRVTCQRQPR